MGLDLVGYQVLVVKDDGTGVVGKYRDADIVIPFILTDRIGGSLDVGLIESIGDVVIHRRCKYSMLTMLAPGLGKRFNLYICRAPPQGMEIVADRMQLVKVERKWSPPQAGVMIDNPFLPEPGKFPVICV